MGESWNTRQRAFLLGGPGAGTRLPSVGARPARGATSPGTTGYGTVTWYSPRIAVPAAAAGRSGARGRAGTDDHQDRDGRPEEIEDAGEHGEPHGAPPVDRQVPGELFDE